MFNVQCSMLALTKIQRISAKAHKHKTSDKNNAIMQGIYIIHVVEIKLWQSSSSGKCS